MEKANENHHNRRSDIMALLTLPAYSQSLGAGPSRAPEKPVDVKKKTADDKA